MKKKNSNNLPPQKKPSDLDESFEQNKSIILVKNIDNIIAHKNEINDDHLKLSLSFYHFTSGFKSPQISKNNIKTNSVLIKTNSSNSRSKVVVSRNRDIFSKKEPDYYLKKYSPYQMNQNLNYTKNRNNSKSKIRITNFIKEDNRKIINSLIFEQKNQMKEKNLRNNDIFESVQSINDNFENKNTFLKELRKPLKNIEGILHNQEKNKIFTEKKNLSNNNYYQQLHLITKEPLNINSSNPYFMQNNNEIMFKIKNEKQQISIKNKDNDIFKKIFNSKRQFTNY